MMHGPIVRGSGNSARYCGQRAFAKKWHKQMSSNIAFALLVSVMFNLFLIEYYLSDFGLGPLYMLWIFIGLMCVPARIVDRRWERIRWDNYTSSELEKLFRFDQAMIWFAAFILPYIWVQMLGLAALSLHVGLELAVPQLITLP